MRRLELLLEAGCRPTVWHNVAPPAFLGRGDAPLPVLDPFDFHEQGVVDSRWVGGWVGGQCGQTP